MSDSVVLEPVTDPEAVRRSRLADIANEERAALAALAPGYGRDLALHALAVRRSEITGESLPAPPVETIRVAWVKASLAQIGKLEPVNAAVTDPVLKALWDSATEIRRDDPDMVEVAAALSIDLDHLWARARAIRAAHSLRASARLK